MACQKWDIGVRLYLKETQIIRGIVQTLIRRWIHCWVTAGQSNSPFDAVIYII